jgi:hypothetical protein
MFILINYICSKLFPKCGKCHFKDTKILKIERGQPHAPRPTKMLSGPKNGKTWVGDFWLYFLPELLPITIKYLYIKYLGTGHYLWQGWGPKRKYNAAGKNHYPTFFETKFPATPPVECWTFFLPHPNLFCCNVKRPDIKYVIWNSLVVCMRITHQGPKLPLMSKIICY